MGDLGDAGGPAAQPDGGGPAPDGGPAAEPAKADAGAQNAGGGQAATSLNLKAAAPLALHLGWTMAVLYGFLPAGKAGATPRTLPTEHQLPRTERIAVELVRLQCLCGQLAKLLPDPAVPLPMPGEPLSEDQAEQLATDADKRKALLVSLNDGLLEAFACADKSLSIAYQLGRSLRDTANLPSNGSTDPELIVQTLADQLNRDRITKLQDWLSTVAPNLPADAAVVVSASVGRWSDFFFVTFDRDTPGKLRNSVNTGDFARETQKALLIQGDVWLNLLIGAEATAGLQTPESNVAAAEAALSRTARIVRRVLRHYWAALVVLAVALGAVLFLASWYLGGAGKVWTQIASIAATLGITARGVMSSVGRFSSAAEKPIYHAEQLDAMAWSVTDLPQAKLNGRGVRRLRRAGIQRSSPLGTV